MRTFIIIVSFIIGYNIGRYIIPPINDTITTTNVTITIKQPSPILSNEELIYTEYKKVGNRLIKDSLINISSEMFAKCATLVAYCESNLNGKSIKLDQKGIAQITSDTRKIIGAPDTLERLSIEQQIYYHEKFIRKCSKKALLAIKNPIDFHALNFAPSRTFNKVLSSVTNKYLKALDFTKDNIISKEDLAIFQKKRLSHTTNKFIHDLSLNYYE